MRFYVGLHHPHVAWRFKTSFISANALRRRKGDFRVNDWIMDSGAFSEISKHGRFRSSPAEYAAQIDRWRSCGNMELAVCQDYMCEPFIVKKTGLSVARHQELTVQRYDALRCSTDASIMPVLQGFQPNEYLDCLALYGTRLHDGMRVGVGSVCKRNSKPEVIEHILELIKSQRPDLRLHGFGLKQTAIERKAVADMLYSSDSMAWSFAARYEGRDGNDWKEAAFYVWKVTQIILNHF